MVQPAVLFVKPDMSVLAKWVQIPTEVCQPGTLSAPFRLYIYIASYLSYHKFKGILSLSLSVSGTFTGAKDRKNH